MVSEIKENGVEIAFGYLEALANLIAYTIEEDYRARKGEGVVQIKMAKGPHDINISIDEPAREYIESQNKKEVKHSFIF